MWMISLIIDMWCLQGYLQFYMMKDADQAEGEDDINEEEENVDDIVDHVVFAKYFSQEFCEEQHEEGANIDIIDDLTTSCKISYAPIIDKGVDDIDHH